MPYLDFHVIETALKATLFTKDELDQARSEMAASESRISSVKNEFLTVGYTVNRFGQKYLSVYADQIWLGILSIDDEGAGKLAESSLGALLYGASSTLLLKEIVEISQAESIYEANRHDEGLGDHDHGLGFVDHEIDFHELKGRIEADGLLTTKKRWLHLTKESSRILHAGGKASARANAILLRYEKMISDPTNFALIAEIAAIEQYERRVNASEDPDLAP